MKSVLVLAVAAAMATAPAVAWAQSDDSAATETAAADGLMTPEELQELVAPVALYPDTLLIQILVAATYPLDVVKADRLVRDNAGKSTEEMNALVEAEGWDESVAVLAEGFPDVLADMAVHIEWTENIGDAMLAQSDDVMAAVQDMRAIANENGVLESGEEQTVEVTQDAGEETIIIQPADPQVVYVPQYDPEVVYVEDSSSNEAGAALFGFTAGIIVGSIWNNNDPWNNYWGCRNCGGWGGGPIINNPNVDINIDGDVNIGNRGDIGWNPGDERRDQARNDIRDKRDPDRPGRLDTKKPDRGDEMRQRLSKETGARDISRPGADRSNVKRPDAGNLSGHKPAIDRTKAGQRPQGGGAKAKPKVSKPAQARPAARKPSHSGGGHAIQKRAPAQRAHSGGNRGRASAGGRGGGGRRR